MRKSTDHILTSQAGSLPRPDDLTELNVKLMEGQPFSEQERDAAVRSAVAEVVKHQVDLGIDVPGDGELGKATRGAVDYGAWWSYSFSRLGGLEITGEPESPPPIDPGQNITLATFATRRDRDRFAAFYADPDSGLPGAGRRGPQIRPVCTGPVTYIGRELTQKDIDNFRAALDANGVQEGFMTSIAPGSASRINNHYYKTHEEFIYACADALREEYKMIIDAGFVLQLDDPAIAENYDMVKPEPALEDYKKFTMVRIEALNYAIKGLPEDRIRFHLCWGSWHGPHMTDIPMKDIVDVMLAVNCQSYSFEAANVRHEHEWKVWQDVKLPEGKIILPGIVSHATNVIEHPELVAERITRFTNSVGRENVIAATDCGLGGRVHPQIAWAKLEVLAQGARLASQQLWR